jgi:hypothetical protein
MLTVAAGRSQQDIGLPLHSHRPQAYSCILTARVTQAIRVNRADQKDK